MKTKTLISGIIISSFFAVISLIALSGCGSSNSNASFKTLLNKYFASSAPSFTEDVFAADSTGKYTFTSKNIFDKTESKDLVPLIKINLISQSTNTQKQTVYTITPKGMKYFSKQSGSIFYVQGQVVKIDNIEIRKPVENMTGESIQTAIIKCTYRYVIKSPWIKNPIILNANPFLKEVIKATQKTFSHDFMFIKKNGRWQINSWELLNDFPTSNGFGYMEPMS